MWLELPIRQVEEELAGLGVSTEGHESVYLVQLTAIISAMPDRCSTTNEKITTVTVAAEGYVSVYMPIDKFMQFLLYAQRIKAEQGVSGIFRVHDWENRTDTSYDVPYKYTYPEIEE